MPVGAPEMLPGTIRAFSSAVLLLAMACGTSNPSAHTPGPSPSATEAGAPAGDAPVEHPFAKSVLEAQTLIQTQIDAHMQTLWKCVDAYRATKNDPHKGVVVDVGIDQEGTLLGVTTPSAKQGELEPRLKHCLWDALHGLPFPRSHAGVITVRQTFTDATVSQ
jgi:hypothetical protein